MKTTDKNNPAFPMNFTRDGYEKQIGIDIRTYIATKAMQGFISTFDTNNPEWCPNMPNIQYACELSVKAADQLIKELNKEK